MSIINLKEKTINAKIVYYGTALGGKTTSLKYVHQVVDPEQKIELVSLNTEKDRTLFFDFLPVSLGRIGDFTVRLQGFTVPGQVKYNLTRKYVLTGADAVVLVVDSQRSQLESNVAALQNLRENLAANGLEYSSIPLVLQYNKRDLPDLVAIGELDGLLNDRGVPALETVAIDGRGVFEAFIEISKQMLDHIAGEYRIGDDRHAIGQALERHLRRSLERARDQAEGADTGGIPRLDEGAPRSAPEEEPDRSHGRVQIRDDVEEEKGELPASEELLRKAVDSNIEIARLYGEVNEIKNRLRDRVRELTALHEVGKTVTSVLDVDRLLQTVLDSATSCLGTEYGSVVLVNRDGNGLIEKVVNGLLFDPLTHATWQGVSQPLLFHLAMRGEGILITEEEGREILTVVRDQDRRIRSFMVAPLLAQKHVVGAISVYFLEGSREGTEDKLRFLFALASHASVALENARLVERIEGFNRELEETVRDRTAALRKAYDDLKELDRLKDVFLSSMSHELLTPLTSIQSFSEILLGMDAEERDASHEEFLGIIHQEAVRLTSRLKDLLDLSQLEAGQVEFRRKPALFREILEVVLREHEEVFREKRIRAVLIAPANTGAVLCDPTWMGRAVSSLLSNAAKFSEEGSEVRIEIREVSGAAQVRVTDHGPGIAPEFQSQVFQRFKQIGDLLTDKPTGTGLGLPLAHEIVRRHQGRIWVQSTPGQGSTFTIALPTAPAAVTS